MAANADHGRHGDGDVATACATTGKGFFAAMWETADKGREFGRFGDELEKR